MRSLYRLFFFLFCLKSTPFCWSFSNGGLRLLAPSLTLPLGSTGHSLCTLTHRTVDSRQGSLLIPSNYKSHLHPTPTDSLPLLTWIHPTPTNSLPLLTWRKFTNPWGRGIYRSLCSFPLTFTFYLTKVLLKAPSGDKATLFGQNLLHIQKNLRCISSQPNPKHLVITAKSLETLTGDMTLFTVFLFYVENTYTRAASTNICTFYEKWK